MPVHLASFCVSSARIVRFAGFIGLVALVGVAGASAAACGAFGEGAPAGPADPDASDTPGDASTGAPIDAAVDADADAPDSGGCPAACDTTCVDDLCPPHELATGLQLIGAPFALDVDVTGVYIGEQAANGGGIWKCGPLPARGARCDAALIFPKPALTAIALGDATIYYAAGATVPSAVLGFVTRAGALLQERNTAAPITDLVGEGTAVWSIGNSGLLQCTVTTGICTISSVPATSIDSRSQFYCVTGTVASKRGVHCAPVAGGALETIAEDDAGALGGVALSTGRAFWTSAGATRSIDMAVDGGSLAGAKVVTAPSTGDGPMAADGTQLYFASGAELFYATRAGAKKRSLAKVSAPIRAVAMFQKYVYFTYGSGSTARLARVPLAN